MALAVLKLEK